MQSIKKLKFFYDKAMPSGYGPGGVITRAKQTAGLNTCFRMLGHLTGCAASRNKLVNKFWGSKDVKGLATLKKQALSAERLSLNKKKATTPENVLDRKDIYNLDTYRRSNQDTCLMHRPALTTGEWVESGDLIADNTASMNGELAIGKNILVAYMPWEGYNYEDSILINERLVYDDTYTSVHIERYEIEIREGQQGSEQITKDIPDLSSSETSHLDDSGIVKVGSWIEEGAILVGKVTPVNPKKQTGYQRLIFKLFDKKVASVRDSSLRAPKGMKANVINVHILDYTFSESQPTKELDKISKSKTGYFSAQHKKASPAVNEEVLQTISPYEGQKLLNHRRVFPLEADDFSTHSTKGNTCQLKNIVALTGSLKNSTSAMLSSHFTTKSPYINTKTVYYESSYSLQRQLRKSKMSQETRPILSKQSALAALPKSTVAQSSLSHKASQKQHKKLVATNVHIYLAEKRKIQVGDKMAGRHGNKGIISNILPRQDMPYLPDGTALDIVLNPLGVPSRMNVGQIYECLLGLAGRYLGEHYKVFSFDELYGAEASRSFVFGKLFEARKKTGIDWLFNPNSPGKIRIFDGRTDESFDQPVTVGIAYMLKLVHMVDDKIHARSTGPYSLVTQQPLRGRAKQGGQRLGEMEVWAIEGFGAAFVLLEMLTLKSDDMTGRLKLWSDLILNQDITIGTPESFKVLVCELQALCLDIGLYTKIPRSTKRLSKSKKFPRGGKSVFKKISHLMFMP